MIDNSSNKKILPIKVPKGKYLTESKVKIFDLKSNNITANKNKIVIAPTYINTKRNAKKSHSKKKSSNADEKKLKIKNSTEYIEFFTVITKKILINIIVEKK